MIQQKNLADSNKFNVALWPRREKLRIVNSFFTKTGAAHSPQKNSTADLSPFVKTTPIRLVPRSQSTPGHSFTWFGVEKRID